MMSHYMNIFHHMTLHYDVVNSVLSWLLPWLSFTFSLHFPSTSLKWTGGVNIQDLGKMLLWQSITGEGRTFDYVRVPQHWSDCEPANLSFWRWLVVGRLVSVTMNYLMGREIQPNRCNAWEATKYEKLILSTRPSLYKLTWMAFALGISRN